MLNRKAWSALLMIVFLIGSTISAQAAPSQQGNSAGPVEVSAAVQHDVSPALRDIPAQSPLMPSIHGDRPMRLLPFGPGGASPQTPGALQTTSGPLVNATAGLNFDGVGDTSNTPSNPCNCAPPDTNGAVGATQYVQWVNTAFAVYDKSTGAKVYGPVAGNTLWSGFGGACETNNDGDPIVQYDKIAQRWIFTQFSVSTTPYTQCVAVSVTSDATGNYYRYSFSYGNTQFNDYPKLSVWPDGYYITYNIFNNGTTFAGSKACAFDRNSMLNGAAATQVCFQLSSSFGGLLPSDLDGASTTLGGPGSTSSAGLPPTGTPNLLLNFGSNSLNLWKFHVDFATPGNSTLTGPTSISVASFSAACNGGGTCIPQPGTSNKLDSLADRLMYRLVYRHFADGHESLLVNHSVFVSGNRKSQVTGVRWYELRNATGQTMASATPMVYQQGTFSPDSTSRWMGSIAMDKNGDIALGYSASSSSVFPSVRYTGRIPTDTLGTMEAETTLFTGPASQTGSLHRWGDYSAMTVDPMDDCTFWYTNEYIPATGSFNWKTRIGFFKLNGCQ